MALVIRGKHAGEQITISQSCNDWVTSMDGRVFTLSQLQYDRKEFEQVLRDADRVRFTPDCEAMRFNAEGQRPITDDQVRRVIERTKFSSQRTTGEEVISMAEQKKMKKKKKGGKGDC